MKNKNQGFTLVEVLAVISIMGVVIVLVIPMLLSTFYNSKNMLDEYTKKDLLDAAKMYVIDLDTNVKGYEYNEETPVEINGNTYNKGDMLTGYDLRVYIIEHNGINVSVKDLVSEEYFDKNCDYEKNAKSCKIKESCILKVKIDGEKRENDRYYVSKGYDAEIFSGCE